MPRTVSPTQGGVGGGYYNNEKDILYSYLRYVRFIRKRSALHVSHQERWFCYRNGY